MHAIYANRRIAGATLAAGLLAGALGLTAAKADASPPAIGLRGKTLIIKGTGASDRLALRRRAGAPGKLEVDVGDNGSADFTIARDEVKRIRVKAGGGDDQVRIDDVQRRLHRLPSRRASTGRAATTRCAAAAAPSGSTAAPGPT